MTHRFRLLRLGASPTHAAVAAGARSRGPFAVVQGAEERRAGLAPVLDGYNIVGIFHGHYLASGQYRWEGYDVYNVGSVKSDWKSFGVVRVTDDRIRVAPWNTMPWTWWWFHEEPINGAKASFRTGASASRETRRIRSNARP